MQAEVEQGVEGTHRVRRTPVVLITLALALALAPAANGATLFSNIVGPAGYGGYQVDTTNQRVAQPFVATASGMPQRAGFFVTALTSATGTTSSASISIYRDIGGQPGYEIADGTPITFDDTNDSEPTCAPLTPVPLFGGDEFEPLVAGRTYWAVFQLNTNHTAYWSGAQVGNDGSPTISTNGGAWSATGVGPRSLFIDSSTTCGAPDITTNPEPGIELGDMYAKPTGTGFQTLFVSRNGGIAELKLTGGSFSGPDASIFKVFKGEPGGPEGSAFIFPKRNVGFAPDGGVFLYIVCAPPGGTPDGEKRATFTLTSNDPEESSLSWPVWCLVDSTPPSLEFIHDPDGRNGWYVTKPFQIRGVDPESGNRVIRILCNDNLAGVLDWRNGSFASFALRPDGIHNLSCQGTDLARNESSVPGGYTTSVKVDATPPQTTMSDSGPPAISEETAFTFSFTGSDATSGVQEFECRLDDAPFELCTSPASVSGLGNRTHTFEVRAVDVAGSKDPSPAQWTWQVNAPPPIVADDAATATVGSPFDIDVLANDVEPRGGTLAILLDSPTTEMGGAVSVAGTTVHYVPPPAFAGTDRFSYRAVNGTGVESVAATVTVQVAGCIVPELRRGSSLGKAKRALTDAGCSAGDVSKARSRRVKRRKLIRLTEEPGTVLPVGSEVGIVVSKGAGKKRRR